MNVWIKIKVLKWKHVIRVFRFYIKAEQLNSYCLFMHCIAVCLMYWYFDSSRVGLGTRQVQRQLLVFIWRLTVHFCNMAKLPTVALINLVKILRAFAGNGYSQSTSSIITVVDASYCNMPFFKRVDRHVKCEYKENPKPRLIWSKGEDAEFAPPGMWSLGEGWGSVNLEIYCDYSW